MKIVSAFCLCSLLICGVALAVDCPEGKYYSSQIRKCITPGDDPTGETERNFRRQLIEDGQAFCVDGWCCPSERVYRECLQSNNRGKCLKKRGCLVYGE